MAIEKGGPNSNIDLSEAINYVQINHQFNMIWYNLNYLRIRSLL